jgi:hypothetical protein
MRHVTRDQRQIQNGTIEMRQALTMLIGRVGVSIVSGKSAWAMHFKSERRTFGQSRSGLNIQNSHWTSFPGELERCWSDPDAPQKPTTPWQGSVAGYGRAQNASTAKRVR